MLLRVIVWVESINIRLVNKCRCTFVMLDIHHE